MRASISSLSEVRAQQNGVRTFFTAEKCIDAVHRKVCLRNFETLDHLDMRLVLVVPHRRASKPCVRDDMIPAAPPVALATVATTADV